MIFRRGTLLKHELLNQLATPRVRATGARVKQTENTLNIDIPVTQFGDGAVPFYNSGDSATYDIPDFGVSVITGTQSDDEGDNLNGPVYTTAQATCATQNHLPIIASNGVEYEDGGYGYINGVQMALLYRGASDTEPYTRAAVTPGEYYLTCGSHGQFEVIWEEQDSGDPKTGEHIGLVRYVGPLEAYLMHIAEAAHGHSVGDVVIVESATSIKTATTANFRNAGTDSLCGLVVGKTTDTAEVILPGSIWLSGGDLTLPSLGDGRSLFLSSGSLTGSRTGTTTGDKDLFCGHVYDTGWFYWHPMLEILLQICDGSNTANYWVPISAEEP